MNLYDPQAQEGKPHFPEDSSVPIILYVVVL